MTREDEALAGLRAAIERVAARDAVGLVAEARAAARARVSAMLTDALAQTMLARAQTELAEAAGDTDRPPVRGAGLHNPTADAGEPVLAARSSVRPVGTDDGWYVYCVVEADAAVLPSALAGIEPAQPASTLRDGDLAAVVSRVPLAEFDEERLREHLSDIAWVERIARAHEDVLERVSSVQTAIPMRICTIYRDEAGVRAMLAREAEPMRATLRELRGKAEWGVKVFALARPPGQPGADAGAPTDRADAGAAYLEQRRREHRERGALDERLETAADSIHERLSEIAARSLLVAPQRPEVSGHPGEMILNGAYLVDDGKRPRFHDAVSALQAELGDLGLEIVPTGPWPAYNFVPDAIGAAR